MKALQTIRRLYSTCPSVAMPAQKMMNAYQEIIYTPESALPVIAWNITETSRLIEGSSDILIKTIDKIADNVFLLERPVIQGALQIMLNETTRLLTETRYTKEKEEVFYPKSLEEHLIQFAESYFRYNPLCRSIRKKLSDPNTPVRFYERLDMYTWAFKMHHDDVWDFALDRSMPRFPDEVTHYVKHQRFIILMDLLRRTYESYPPNITFFNDEMRVIELMFGKTSLSARKSQKLVRGALNSLLYGCEDYAHVEETIDRLQKDSGVVSEYLKLISGDIRRHEREYGFALPSSFVPDPAYFTIHTSFRDKVLNNLRASREKS